MTYHLLGTPEVVATVSLDASAIDIKGSYTFEIHNKEKTVTYTGCKARVIGQVAIFNLLEAQTITVRYASLRERILDDEEPE